MISLVILFIGTFWEASMDIIGNNHNYERSVWRKLASFFDANGWTKFGNSFWDNSIAWRNKWKNKDPLQGEYFLGSSTFFVFLTDGWHVVKFFWLIHFFSTIVFYNPIFDYIIFDFILFKTVFGLGHEFFLRILLKNN